MQAKDDTPTTDIPIRQPSAHELTPQCVLLTKIQATLTHSHIGLRTKALEIAWNALGEL